MTDLFKLSALGTRLLAVIVGSGFVPLGVFLCVMLLLSFVAGSMFGYVLFNAGNDRGWWWKGR